MCAILTPLFRPRRQIQLLANDLADPPLPSRA